MGHAGQKKRPEKGEDVGPHGEGADGYVEDVGHEIVSQWS
jgi:hypothetical protein